MKGKRRLLCKKSYIIYQTSNRPSYRTRHLRSFNHTSLVRFFWKLVGRKLYMHLCYHYIFVTPNSNYPCNPRGSQNSKNIFFDIQKIFQLGFVKKQKIKRDFCTWCPKSAVRGCKQKFSTKSATKSWEKSRNFRYGFQEDYLSKGQKPVLIGLRSVFYFE